MKCLSVSQPFAHLIITGKKTIDLRGWNTNYRGDLLIHSPLKIRTKDCKRLKITQKLPAGYIVGKVQLYDVKKYETKTELKSDLKYHFAGKEFSKKKYGFLLKNAKMFRIPIPYKGQLGLFEVNLPKTKIRKNNLKADIIDEEYRYQWINHH